MPRVPNKKQNRIVQIDVTSVCDLQCSNCTRALAQIKKPDMTLEQFEWAVFSSKDWIIREKGVLAIFGGNPAASKNFEDYCRILADNLPEENRGLWCNNFLGKGEVVRKYFGPRSTFNLVAHNKPEAAAEIQRAVPWATVHGARKGSKHASIFVAAQDFLPEDDLWAAVENCTYDITWSAIIIQEAPDWQKLGGYSCEIASTHARTNGKALGIEIKPGWLDCTLEDVQHQYDYACRRCGGCLNLEGVEDLDYKDQYSETNKNIVELTLSKKRPLEEVREIQQNQAVPTDYLKLRSK